MAALDPMVARWIRQEVTRLAAEGIVPGTPREAEVLAHWRRHRPEMYRKLEKANLAPEMAMVLVQKCYLARQQYIQAGWPPTDAEEQAVREWLLQEPEDETNPQPILSVPIST